MAETDTTFERRVVQLCKSFLETRSGKGRIAYVRCRGVTHRLEIGEDDVGELGIPVLMWATQLDERGGAFLVSVFNRYKIKWNGETETFEDEDEQQYDVGDILWQVEQEFDEQGRDLEVSVWFTTNPSSPSDDIASLYDIVRLGDYESAQRGPKDDCMDYYKECVDAVDALMLQMLSTLKDAEVPVKTFLVKHKDTNTVVKIPALNESHAFWKWATESSAGLFNPWDLVDECLALGRWWTYNLDMDHLYHWTRAVHNGNLGYPSPKDLMEDLTRKFTNVVSIEAEAESITE